MKRAAVCMFLFLLAAAYMRIGLFIPIDWMDEGQIVYGIWRVAAGEVPYRDFQHLYGPSIFFFNGYVLRFFGEDLASLRYCLLAVKAATCVMVYISARMISGPAFSFIAYSLAVVMSGLAWVVSTTPYASFFGIAFCFAGLLVLLKMGRKFLLGCALAGICFGLAATFKQTTGVFCFLATALFLLNDSGAWSARPGARVAAIVSASRWSVLLIPAVVALAYVSPRRSVWTAFVLLTPLLLVLVSLARNELGRQKDRECDFRNFCGHVALTLGFLSPLVGYAALYIRLGHGADLLRNTLTVIPSIVDWFTPFPDPVGTLVLWFATCTASIGFSISWARRVPGRLHVRDDWLLLALGASSISSAVALIVRGWESRNEEWWFWATSDLLFCLPVLVVWIGAAAWIRARAGMSPVASQGEERAVSLFTLFAVTALIWLYPAADIWHVVGILPACLPLLSFLLHRYWSIPGDGGADVRQWRTMAGFVIGIFYLLLTVPAERDLWVATQGRPGFDVPLARATGVRGDSALYSSTRNGGKLVRYLGEAANREEPLYVLPAKQLFYFLAGRPSPVQEFEFTLYLTAFRLIHEDRVSEMIDEARLVGKLREVRPLIVDDAHDDAAANIRRAFPHLSGFIDSHYRVEREFGRFRVLRFDEDSVSR